MDQEGSKSSQNCHLTIDNLAALNIIPFLGLMNLMEVRYLHMPEVYRTMLAILCDYDPLSQENIVRTRRYLSVLLSREPDLAQCLLNFIDTPQETTAAPVHADAPDNTAKVTNENNSHQCTTQRLSTQSEDERLTDSIQDEPIPIQRYFPSEQRVSSQKTENQTPDNSKHFMSTRTSATTYGQPDIQTISFCTEALRNMHPSPFDPQNIPPGYTDQMSKSGPLINIYHKDIFAMESAARMNTTAQQQAAPCSLPGFLTSHLTSAEAASLMQTTVQCETATEHRDQIIFASSVTPSSSQPRTEEDSAVFSTQVTDCPNVNIKSGRYCSVDLTQTLENSLDRTNKLHDNTSADEIPVPASLSRSTPAASESSTETVATLANHPSTVTPNICLSKLLGQPSVAYLPAGHFIDNRNSIVGASVCKSTGAEQLPYTCSVLGGKMNSAAAKLHLLSTQAGNEKIGSLQEGHGKPVTSVTSNFGTLSTPVPLVQKDSTIKATMKLSSKPGCRKMITLSKIVPVLKIDSAPEQADVKVNTVSFDKQVQVGQRQICKKSKTLRKEQACQMYSDTKQLINHPINQEQPLRQHSGGEMLADEQKERCVPQQTHTSSLEKNTDGERLEQYRKETQILSASQQKCPVTKKLRVAKQKPHNNNTSVQRQRKSGKSLASEKKQITEKLLVDLQQSQNLTETQENQNLGWNQEDKTWAATCGAVSSGKHTQQHENEASIKPTAKRQKVQVVGMPMGTSPSLSAFPYIQQMILPDGQVSTIAHNSHAAHTRITPHQRAGEILHDSATYSTKPSTTASICYTIQERKEPSSKPTTQIVLPKNQLKLSVSIQTPPVNCSSTSCKKQKTTTSHPVHLPCFKNNPLMTHTTQTISEATTKNNQDASCKLSVEKNTLADVTNMFPRAHTTGNGQGKRKRSSPSCRRNVTAKTVKLPL